MDFLEVSLPSNRFWSNSEAKFRQNWDFANRMRSVVSVVSTDNFVTAARQGRLSLLRLRTLCQSKVFLAIFRYFGLFWPKNGILFEYIFLLFCIDFLLCFDDYLTRFFFVNLKCLKYWNLPQNCWTSMCSGWRGLFAEKLEASTRSPEWVSCFAL